MKVANFANLARFVFEFQLTTRHLFAASAGGASKTCPTLRNSGMTESRLGVEPRSSDENE